MKIYDITQELFSCVVFPGDPAPQKNTLCSMAKGDLYNLTSFSMCAHNGTHIDAPSHFIIDGKNIDEIELSKLIGYAYVAEHNGFVTLDVAKEILKRAKEQGKDAWKKILVKGNATLTLEASEFFAKDGIDLYGNESQTVGPEDAPMAVHKVLLSAEVVLLEGIRLSDVPEGVYLLHAAPICLGQCEGAPCRATLIKQ